MTPMKWAIGMTLLAGFLLLGVIAAAGDDASKKKDKAYQHLMEARRLAADYKIDRAADKARDALKDDPTLAEAHVYLGLQRFRANDLKGAQAEFSTSLEMDPYQPAAHCQLAYVLYQQGQLEDATDHWTLAFKLDSTSPQIIAGVSLSQFKHGQQDDALKTFEKALMYDRRFANPQFLSGDSGPKWSGPLLQDFQELLAKVPKSAYP